MEKRFWYPGCRFALPWAMITLGFQPVFVSSHDSARRDVACYVSWYNRFVNQLFVDGVWRRCTQRLYGLLTICYTCMKYALRARTLYYILLEGDYFLGSVSKKRSFSRYTIWSMKKAKHHLCLAWHDPARHPVRTVGTQRVALNKTSMRLRVKARKETEGEHVETYMQRSKWLV